MVRLRGGSGALFTGRIFGDQNIPLARVYPLPTLK